MDISLIIPCHNEESNISLLIDECEKCFKELKIEYILINDGSKDNTFEEIKKLKNRNINFTGISFSKNFGKEAAIYAGLLKATGNYAAIIDADLQQHPRYVLEMYKFIKENPQYDSITCYQEKRKEGKLITLLKKLFYKFINKISEVEFYENASDFRLFNRKVINSLIEMKENYRFSKGLFSWIGYNTYYMPYKVEERKYGKSSWSIKSLFKYAIDGILGFSISPLKISMNIGFICLLSTLIYFIVNIITQNINHFSIIICLIGLFSGLQMVFIGVIGEYLGRVYIETKHRPIYIIKEEVKNK